VGRMAGERSEMRGAAEKKSQEAVEGEGRG